MTRGRQQKLIKRNLIEFILKEIGNKTIEKRKDLKLNI